MLGVEPLEGLAGGEMHTPGSALVFLNGNLLGVHRRPKALVTSIR